MGSRVTTHAGEQCKAYGVGGVMRMPIRLRVSWQDDTNAEDRDRRREQARLSIRPGRRSGRHEATGKGVILRVVGSAEGPMGRGGDRRRRAAPAAATGGSTEGGHRTG